MKNILFITHRHQSCGVYQYGKQSFDVMQKVEGYNFRYGECSSADELLKLIKLFSPSAVVYNYHPATLPFVTPEFLAQIRGCLHIGLMHEISQEMLDACDGSFFDYMFYGDPTLIEKNPRVFKIGRLIKKYKNPHPLPAVPTIGSYGFGGISKGYDVLVNLVYEEFEEAIIRINIPPSGIFDYFNFWKEKISKIQSKNQKKSGIKIEITNHFYNNEELLDFLGRNSINVFTYPMDWDSANWGISSAVDAAIAAKRPIGISNNNLFRHLHSIKPSIILKSLGCKSRFFNLVRILRSLITLKKPKIFEYSKLSEIIKNGITPLESLCRDWSEDKLIDDYRKILSSILEGRGFNRILDNNARKQYQSSIATLFKLDRQGMKRKIPEANVQQGFVFDTVRRFASKKSKILCVGSFEDTAATSLLKLKYPVECIDPVKNYDLNSFFHLPSTQKASYNLIFSTSVIEHVENDELFIQQIKDLLAPNGIAVLTCDYKDDYKIGDFIFPGNYRFYTQKDFKDRFLPILYDCSLIDIPNWECQSPDFIYQNQKYTFATLVFKKNGC